LLCSDLVNSHLPNLSTLQVSVVEEQGQESAKSDDENKANDEDHSSEPSNGKTDINDTPMDESQVTVPKTMVLLLICNS
jgi:hypothetical protein